jgi:putative signal transducing protein
MKLLYTAENRFLVSNIQNIIENAGISVMLKNEFAGGAAGDLVPLETWMEVWVEDEDVEKASSIIETSFSKTDDQGWVCSQCSEYNDASFDYCWNCQHASDQ